MQDSIVILLKDHFLLTVSLANEGQHVGVGGGACHAGAGESGGSFCVLKEAGVDLPRPQSGEARNGNYYLRRK